MGSPTTINLQVNNHTTYPIWLSKGKKIVGSLEKSSQVFAVPVNKRFTIRTDGSNSIHIDLEAGEATSGSPDRTHFIQLSLCINPAFENTYTKSVKDTRINQGSNPDLLDIIIDLYPVSQYPSSLPDPSTPMFFIQEVRAGDGVGDPEDSTITSDKS